MVSALFQSRPSERGGTGKFTIGHCSFGWSVIEDLHTRELERIKAGQCSRVPKLKDSYVQRDSWTRMYMHMHMYMYMCMCMCNVINFMIPSL